MIIHCRKVHPSLGGQSSQGRALKPIISEKPFGGVKDSLLGRVDDWCRLIHPRSFVLLSEPWRLHVIEASEYSGN